MLGALLLALPRRQMTYLFLVILGQHLLGPTVVN